MCTGVYIYLVSYNFPLSEKTKKWTPPPILKVDLKIEKK